MPVSPSNLSALQQLAGSARGDDDSSGRFSRESRLLSPAQFKRVFSDPCRVSTPPLTFLAAANDLDKPRLGLAISRKNVRKAVHRNRLKRQIRESFRLHQAIIGGFDVVVLARPGADRVPQQELRQMIDEAWSRLAKRCVKS